MALLGCAAWTSIALINAEKCASESPCWDPVALSSQALKLEFPPPREEASKRGVSGGPHAIRVEACQFSWGGELGFFIQNSGRQRLFKILKGQVAGSSFLCLGMEP